MPSDEGHPVARLLANAARGRFPPADGGIEVLPPPPGRAMAVVAFAAHHVIATSAPEHWVREHLRDGDLQTPMSPRFLARLGEQLQRHDDGIDVVCAAPGLPHASSLVEAPDPDHPRIDRAQAYRSDVKVYSDASGAATVILGRGLAGRLEVAIDVDEAARNQGLAARALIEARHLIGPDQALFAQTAPGNAASLRAILAAGFRPIGSEVLFFGGER